MYAVERNNRMSSDIVIMGLCDVTSIVKFVIIIDLPHRGHRSYQLSYRPSQQILPISLRAMAPVPQQMLVRSVVVLVSSDRKNFSLRCDVVIWHIIIIRSTSIGNLNIRNKNSK